MDVVSSRPVTIGKRSGCSDATSFTHPKKPHKTTPVQFVPWLQIENYSFHCGTEFQQVLKYSLDMLREKDIYALISEEADISEAEVGLLKDTTQPPHQAKLLNMLGDMLVQYQLYHEAYYFYHRSFSICKSLDDRSSRTTHNCLLQMGKILYNEKLKDESHSPVRSLSLVAHNIFEWLAVVYKSSIAASFLGVSQIV